MNKLTPLTPTISAIKLPDGTDSIEVCHTPRYDNTAPMEFNYRHFKYPIGTNGTGRNNSQNYTSIKLPPGKWHILGPVSELTPEQKAEIVEITDNPFWIRQGKPYIDYTCNTNCFSSIDDAFQSLLQSKRVYTVNPYGEKPIEPVTYTGKNFVEYAMAYSGEVEKRNEAQQYVGNWILIKKEV